MASGFQCSSANREKELEQMQDQVDWAGFMLDLYDSEKVVGIVDGLTYEFQLKDPIYPYAVRMRS